MARMLTLEQGNESVTYATITNDKSLVIHKNFLDSRGFVVAQDSILISATGTEALLKLLRISLDSRARDILDAKGE